MPRERHEKDTQTSARSPWVAGGQYAGLGLQLALSIGLFLWLGWLADKRLGVTPLFTIIGAFVGAGGGFYSLYRQLILTPGEDDEPS